MRFFPAELLSLEKKGDVRSCNKKCKTFFLRIVKKTKKEIILNIFGSFTLFQQETLQKNVLCHINFIKIFF